jgi:hypothetical protein
MQQKCGNTHGLTHITLVHRHDKCKVFCLRIYLTVIVLVQSSSTCWKGSNTPILSSTFPVVLTGRITVVSFTVRLTIVWLSWDSFELIMPSVIDYVCAKECRQGRALANMMMASGSCSQFFNYKDQHMQSSNAGRNTSFSLFAIFYNKKIWGTPYVSRILQGATRW